MVAAAGGRVDRPHAAAVLVVGHDEQDRFLAGWQQLLVDLLPFEIAEMQIVLVLLGELGALALSQFKKISEERLVFMLGYRKHSFARAHALLQVLRQT